MTRAARRPIAAVAAAVAVAAAAAGCTGTGDFTLFGYSTAPPFDPTITSVYVPVFKNVAFVADPHRGIEVDVTEEIVRELGRRRTPMRVVSDPNRAQTELIGTIVQVDKTILNRNQLNYARELELVVTAEVVWRDLKTGKVLTDRRRTPVPAADAFDPSLPPPPEPAIPLVANPVRVTSVGRFIPEVGESNATGQQKAVQMLARQIVDMMEAPW